MPHPNQLCLFENYTPHPPPQKLRVRWGCSTGDELFIPRHKSIEPDTSIYEAYEQGITVRTMDWIDLGIFDGQCFCESVAITIDAERYVLSVIHLPGDEHSMSGHKPLS